MRAILIISIFLFAFQLFSQKKEPRVHYYSNGQLVYRGTDSCIDNNIINCSGIGLWEEWYKNGQKKLECYKRFKDEDFYINGWLPSGKQILIDGDGFFYEVTPDYLEPEFDSVVFEIKDSLRHGITSNYKLNDFTYILVEKVEYKIGQKDGSYKAYHLNGRLKEEGQNKLGKKHGKWKLYDENGQLIQIIEYKEGDFFGNYITYYPNGSVKIQGQYNQIEGFDTVIVWNPLIGNCLQSLVPNSQIVTKKGEWKYYNIKGQRVDPKIIEPPIAPKAEIFFDDCEFIVARKCDSMLYMKIADSHIYVEISGVKYPVEKMNLSIYWKGEDVMLFNVKGNQLPDYIKRILNNTSTKGFILSFDKIFYKSNDSIIEATLNDMKRVILFRKCWL